MRFKEGYTQSRDKLWSLSYPLAKLSAHLIHFLWLEITPIKQLDFLTGHFLFYSEREQSLLRQVTAKHYFQRLDSKVKHTGQDWYTEYNEMFCWSFCIFLTSLCYWNLLKDLIRSLKYFLFPFQCKTSGISWKYLVEGLDKYFSKIWSLCFYTDVFPSDLRGRGLWEHKK